MTTGTTAGPLPHERWRTKIARRLEKPWQRVAAVAAALATLVGLADGSWALYRHLFPSPPSQDASATVEQTVLANVPLATFVRAHPRFAPGRRFTPEQLATEGAVFTLDLTLQGLDGTDTFVRWRIDDPDLGARRSLPAWAPRSRTLRPEGDHASLSPDIWMPYPVGPSGNLGVFVARFTIGSRKHRQLGAPAVSRRIQYFNP